MSLSEQTVLVQLGPHRILLLLTLAWVWFNAKLRLARNRLHGRTGLGRNLALQGDERLLLLGAGGDFVRGGEILLSARFQLGRQTSWHFGK